MGTLRTAVFCVGNKLMLDDGLGPAVYDQLQPYNFGKDVDLFDVGCLTMGNINAVRDYDVVVTVDAADGTGLEVGTILKYAPEDMARRSRDNLSLHDLKLSDLFDSAALLGYSAQGICLGMQIENASPSLPTVGLTRVVQEQLPNLVDALLATLVSLGHTVVVRATSEVVAPGFHHTLI